MNGKPWRKLDFYGHRPQELAEHLGGWGRATEPWRLVREGKDPFAPGNLPAAAFERLNALCVDARVSLERSVVAPCGTRKLRLRLEDGRAIETVLIPGSPQPERRGPSDARPTGKDSESRSERSLQPIVAGGGAPRINRRTFRTTVCVSSQVGCARGCTFCVTATLGLVRSLHASEITAQVKLARDEATRAALPPLRNVVFMGMGEPLDNLAEVRQAVAILTDRLAFEIAPRHVTLSTVGTSPAAILAAADVPAQIAWSIHAVDDDLRRQLVPTSKHSLSELRAAFLELLAPRRATLFVEMTLMRDVNDDESHAERLAEFLVPFRPRVRVNLLPMNPGRSELAPTSIERALRFGQVLRDRGYFCALRRPRGVEQYAACGQLGIDEALVKS